MPENIPPISPATYEDLITAFASDLTLNNCFYWKKANQQLIEVTLTDYLWLEDPDDDEVEHGPDPQEQQDIREALEAIQNNAETHVSVPKLSLEKRMELMEQFAASVDIEDFSALLNQKLKRLCDMKSSTLPQLSSQEMLAICNLDHFTYDLPELARYWKSFYRKAIRNEVDVWLKEMYSKGKNS